MTNEQKANEIAEKYSFEYDDLGFKYEFYDSALEMAEFKDQQIKKVLDDVANIFSDKSNPTDLGVQLAIKTIKNKLNFE